MEIVLATSNKHKIQEMNAIVTGLNIDFILPPKDFNPEENGSSFEQNSFIKAYKAWSLVKKWTLADDSGLCIDFLGGAPGIRSARYDTTPEKRINRVLKEMRLANDRHAQFKCAMTLINPYGEIAFKYTGICEGTITREPRGNNGFGYDPIFLLKNSEKTMAELSEEEKNKISHRGQALSKVVEYLVNTQLFNY